VDGDIGGHPLFFSHRRIDGLVGDLAAAILDYKRHHVAVLGVTATVSINGVPVT